MNLSSKRILVIANDRVLRETRGAVLRSDGYRVCEVESDDGAMVLLGRETFDLVLLGRALVETEVGIAQRIRERHPDLPLLRIATWDAEVSPYCSRTTAQSPAHVLEAVRTMLAGDEVGASRAGLAGAPEGGAAELLAERCRW